MGTSLPRIRSRSPRGTPPPPRVPRSWWTARSSAATGTPAARRSDRWSISAFPSGRDAPYDANFSASVGGGIPPYNFAWDFGDGSQGAGGSVSHVYTMAGTFDVTVNVTDLTGQEELLNTTVVVYPSLTTGITGGPFGPHIFPLVVGFTALPTGGSGAPYNLTWDFGDGSATATGSQVGHEYDFPGTYRATLTTEDSTGATAFAAVNITVVRPLELTLAVSGAATGEAPFEANFTATMQFGGSPVGLLWTFGDGTGQSGGLSASHTYGAAGTYHVSLVGSDTAGDHVVRSVNVTVSAALQSPLIAATQLSTSCSPRARPRSSTSPRRAGWVPSRARGSSGTGRQARPSTSRTSTRRTGRSWST